MVRSCQALWLAPLLLGLLGAASPEPSGPGWGTHMMEVGARFALAASAAHAGNFLLADYELDELGEVLGRARATPQPDDVPREVKLAGLADAFVRETLPALRAAARKADRRAFQTAWATAVLQCNACHKTAGKPFLKVLAAPKGTTVLDLTP